MAITWILVANASLARLYANFGPKQGLQLVKELVHPESRMKNSELSSDRAGQIQSNGSGHGAREQQTPPKLNAAKNFAQMLAKELYLGRSRNAFGRAKCKNTLSGVWASTHFFLAAKTLREDLAAAPA